MAFDGKSIVSHQIIIAQFLGTVQFSGKWFLADTFFQNGWVLVETFWGWILVDILRRILVDIVWVNSSGHFLGEF